MRTKVQKWGNSLGIRIPKAVAEDIDVRAGGDVDLKVEGSRLVIVPVRKRRYVLASLLRQVTRQNLHDEVEFGKPVGREAW